MQAVLWATSGVIRRHRRASWPASGSCRVRDRDPHSLPEGEVAPSARARRAIASSRRRRAWASRRPPRPAEAGTGDACEAGGSASSPLAAAACRRSRTTAHGRGARSGGRVIVAGARTGSHRRCARSRLAFIPLLSGGAVASWLRAIRPSPEGIRTAKRQSTGLVPEGHYRCGTAPGLHRTSLMALATPDIRGERIIATRTGRDRRGRPLGTTALAPHPAAVPREPLPRRPARSADRARGRGVIRSSHARSRRH